MIQDLSGSWCIKETDGVITRMDLLVPLMHHDPDRSWLTDLDPDHLKGMHPESNQSQVSARRQKSVSYLS